MKAFGRIVLVIFILSLGIFAFSEIKQKLHPDPAPPVITSSMDTIEIPCNYTNEQIMQGLSASGEKDGDLTDQIMVGNISRFREKGVSTVTYVVFDSYNQPTSYSRDVVFSDYHSPEFTLEVPLVFRCGEVYGIETYIGATDVLFGQIDNAVRYEENNINFSAPGNYYLTVEASNGYGDSSMQQLPLHIVEAENLELQVNLKQGIVYIDKGEEIEPSDYIESVIGSDGTVLSNLLVSCRSEVDEQTPGIYEIKYIASYNGEKGLSWLTVVVRE